MNDKEILLAEIERQKRINAEQFRELEEIKRNYENAQRRARSTGMRDISREIEDRSDRILHYVFMLETAIRRYLGIENEHYGAYRVMEEAKDRRRKALAQVLIDYYKESDYEDE